MATTSSATTRLEDDDSLALSLSITKRSGRVNTDLCLMRSEETRSNSPSPCETPPASTGLQFQVFDLNPLPVEMVPSPTLLQPPSHPASNFFLHLGGHQNYLPSHATMGGISVSSSLAMPIQQQQYHHLPSSPLTEQRRPPPLHTSFPPQRSLRQPRHTLPEGKDESITPPYPWATDRRATLYPLDRLVGMGITTIHGEVQCRKCEFSMTMEYELQVKFAEVASLIDKRIHSMHNCALPEWMNPAFQPCPSCQTPNCMRPVIPPKKRDINWLFMLLGQTIGTCTLDQLKYFCKHTRQHRTGAKNRLLFSTYMGICKQLNPNGVFEETY